jgi:hypothetical protein
MNFFGRFVLENKPVVREVFGKKHVLFGKCSGSLREKGPFVRELFGKAARSIREVFGKRLGPHRERPDGMSEVSRTLQQPVTHPSAISHDRSQNATYSFIDYQAAKLVLPSTQ